jgi:hypothetical protein
MGFKEYHKCQNNMGQLWAKIRSQQWVEIGLGLKQYHKSKIQVMGQQKAKTKVASFMGCFFFFFFFLGVWFFFFCVLCFCFFFFFFFLFCLFFFFIFSLVSFLFFFFFFFFSFLYFHLSSIIFFFFIIKIIITHINNPNPY